MKLINKILPLLIISCCLLTGCDHNETCVAKYQDDEKNISMTIDYADNEILGYHLESVRKLPKKVIKQIGINNIDSYTKKILASFNKKGIEVESEYRSDKQEIVIYLDVDLKSINKKDYKLFGIEKNKDFNKFKKLLIKNGFKIKKSK